jgi:hypothetical protein
MLDKCPTLEQQKVECIIKMAGYFNKLTRWRETERTATIFDIFSGTLIEQTWYPKEYGTGLLQADAALMLSWCRGGSRGSRFLDFD